MSDLRTDARPTRTRHAALDGFRALAITTIVLFHFHLRDGDLIAGYVGGDMFLAASGFLVTAALVSHRDPGPRVVTRWFVSRAKRLLPALVLFLVVWLAAAAVAGQSGWFNVDPFGPKAPGPHLDFGDAAHGALLAVTLTINWAKALHAETPLLLGHLWFIAALEQFYVVWVPLLVACVRRSHRLALGVAVAGAVASFAASLLLWRGGAGADHVYFGTDSRAQSLFIGAAAALAWSGGWFHVLPRALRTALAAAGWATVLLMAFRYSGDVIKFRGGFALAALASVAIITHLLDGTGRVLSTALSLPPLVWIGRRSYAIYLWHYPFACWTHRLPDPIGVPLGLTATLIATELSWRLVESRFGQRPERAVAADLPSGAAGATA
jgi:peptidoglycan/LPS O-acetylase OafA/YrhL